MSCMIIEGWAHSHNETGRFLEWNTFGVTDILSGSLQESDFEHIQNAIEDQFPKDGKLDCLCRIEIEKIYDQTDVSDFYFDCKNFEFVDNPEEPESAGENQEEQTK